MLSTQLKLLREKRNVSQSKLARALGVSQQAIAKWEGGQSEPPSSTVKKLADFFGVSADYLLGDESPEAVFSSDELSLMSRYRMMNESHRQLIVQLMDAINGALDPPSQPLIQQNNNVGDNVFNVNAS